MSTSGMAQDRPELQSYDRRDTERRWARPATTTQTMYYHDLIVDVQHEDEIKRRWEGLTSPLVLASHRR